MSNENSFWVCFVALGNYVNYWNCSSGPAPMLGCERVLLPYRLSFYFDTCDMHVTCVLVPLLGCRLYQRRLMPPCSSCLRPDQMLPGPDFICIISYAPVKKWSMSSGWEIIGNEGSGFHSHMYERLESECGMEEGAETDTHATIKRERRTKQCGQLLDNSGRKYPPCFTLCILVIKARFFLVILVFLLCLKNKKNLPPPPEKNFYFFSVYMYIWWSWYMVFWVI